MKGVFVINASLHDVVFMSVDHDFRLHCMRLAVNWGLIVVSFQVLSEGWL
jgi:hypothetical protein